MTDALIIGPEDPTHPEAAALIALAAAERAATTPPDQVFGESAEGLAARGVWFVLARRGGAAVGCGGLALFADYAEVKRMYVAKPARGSGVAEAVLAALEAEARARNLSLLRLETGWRQAPAIALYTRLGFEPCGRFGDYPKSPGSLYFEKPL